MDNEFSRIAEQIARRLLPEGADREAMQVEAFLAGNCTECFTERKIDGLPSTVSLCAADAEDEGWACCQMCGEWSLDWHRWGEIGSLTCPDCLTGWEKVEGLNLLSKGVSGIVWEAKLCDCDKCFWRNRG